jgi:hypothetical protein
MTRSVLAVAALVLMALVGLTAALAVYDLASIYGDPTGSELAMFVPFGVPGLIVVTLLLGAAAGAVALSRGRMRRPVTVTAAVIAGVSIIGIVVGNHYGVEDKRADTARPPECGIQNTELRREFAEIDHPGYFGGGSASRSDCSYLLSTEHGQAALDEYADGLRGRGYTVARDADGLTAEHERFSFRARVESVEQSDDHLTVTLRERG